MNTELKKADSLIDKLRRLFNEQLWLLLLLAPLLIIATLVSPHFISSKSQVINTKRASAMLAVSAEISSAELVSIVAKPLTELLAMEVYFDHQSKSRKVARISSLALAEDFRKEAYNQSLTNHSVSYVLVGEPIKDRTDG
jgi:hypothetical protein